MIVKGKKTLKEIGVVNELDKSKELGLTVDVTATTGKKTTVVAKQTNDRTITLPDATTTLVGKDTTDSLSNKTIDPYLDYKHTTTPANPPSGSARFYTKADNKAYILTNVGTEKKIGSGAGAVKVSFHDPVNTTLPSGGIAYIADGVSAQENDLVLFTNLATNNNRVYKITGVGSSITFIAQPEYDNGVDPEDGDSVRVQKGNAFADQLGVFNGTAFKFNDVIRQFEGANFVETTSIKATTLNNNSSGQVFTTNALGSENMIVDYSLTRGTSKEAGQLFVTSNGVDVSVSTANTGLGSDSGVVFSANISTGIIRLNYTTTNTGVNASMKYILKRWSDLSGGPTGAPTYTPSTGSSVLAAGNNTEIQYNDNGVLGGSSLFKLDTVNSTINLNGLEMSGKIGPFVVTDGASNQTVYSFPATEKSAIIEYQYTRQLEVKTGRLMLAHNGTIVALSDDYIETDTLTAFFDADINGSNIDLKITHPTTGFNGSISLSFRRF